MVEQLKARLGPAGLVAVKVAIGIACFLIACFILGGGFVPGLSFALRSVLYMLPFLVLGVLAIMAVQEGYISSRLGTPILALLFALSIGVMLILWGGRDPFKAYGALLVGSIGSLQGISETIVNMTPLVLTGLSVAFANRCNLFNIGAEGQFIVGQMGAAWAGYALQGLPRIIHLPLTLLFGILAGALWGAIPGILKAKRGVHEVINTIMMNYIALLLTHNLVTGVLKAPGFLPVTSEIAPTAKLIRLLGWLSPTFRLNTGILVALGAAAFVFWLLWKTTSGYEIRAVGLNAEAARYGGISVGKNVVLAMTIAGGLAGMAGAVHVMGIQYKFIDIFTFTGYGFDGIAVALLGNSHPVGVVIGSLVFGALSTGASRMQLIAGVSKQIIVIVQAIIVFFVAAEELIRRFTERSAHKAETIEAGREVAGQ